MKQAVAIAMVMWFGLAMACGDAPDSKSKPAQKAFWRVRIDLSPAYPGVEHVANVRFPDLPGCEIKEITGDHFILCNISVNLEGIYPTFPRSSDANDVANEYVESMKSSMNAVISGQEHEYQRELEDLEQRLKSEQEREGNASDQLAQLRAAVASDTGMADASSENARALTQNMEIIRETAELDIAGKTARQKALADAIAKLSDQVELKLNSDPIGEQLQKVADSRQKSLDAIEPLQKVGGATDENVNDAMAALAEAKAALLERKEAAAKIAGADILEQWNTDLLSISVDMAELHARLDAMTKRLAALQQAMQAIQEMPSQDSLQKNLDTTKEHIYEMKQQMSELRADLDEKNIPKLTVLEKSDVQTKN